MSEGNVVELVPKTKRGIRLLIGFPHIGMVEVGFVMSLLGLYKYVITNPNISDDLELEFVTVVGVGGSMLPKQRDELVTHAKACQATHILFVDSDMSFDEDICHKLLRARKAVIACNASTKQSPPNPTARDFDPNDPTGIPVYSTKQRPPVEEIWRIGTGIMLIDIEALDKIPQPWFMMTYDVTRGAHCGEDWFFCKLVKGYGIPVHIHHHASMTVGHIGKFTYTLDKVNQHRAFLKQKESSK